MTYPEHQVSGVSVATPPDCPWSHPPFPTLLLAHKLGGGGGHSGKTGGIVPYSGE